MQLLTGCRTISSIPWREFSYNPYFRHCPDCRLMGMPYADPAAFPVLRDNCRQFSLNENISDMNNFVLLVVVILIAILIVAAAIGIAKLIAPRSYNPQKGEAYECGIPTRGKSWMQFKVGYYLSPYFSLCSMWRPSSCSHGRW